MGGEALKLSADSWMLRMSSPNVLVSSSIARDKCLSPFSISIIMASAVFILAFSKCTGQQLHGRLALPKSSCPVEPTPAKYLVRVDAMRPRYPRHRRPFNQRLFDNPSLLRDTVPLPRSRAQQLLLVIPSATCREVSISAPGGRISGMSTSAE